MKMLRVLYHAVRQGRGMFEWERRLYCFYHTPWFGLCYTTIWDSTPYEISSLNLARQHHRTAWSGKDKVNCLNAMFLGLPVAEYGLVFPKVYGANIMRRIDLGRYPTHDDEMRLGE